MAPKLPPGAKAKAGAVAKARAARAKAKAKAEAARDRLLARIEARVDEMIDLVEAETGLAARIKEVSTQIGEVEARANDCWRVTGTLQAAVTQTFAQEVRALREAVARLCAALQVPPPAPPPA